jgi:hypothetical protein
MGRGPARRGRGVGRRAVPQVSKGSGRRPAAVPDDEVQRNWERTFPREDRVWFKTYVFEATAARHVREEIVAESEEEARSALPPAPVPTVTDWTLVDVKEPPA